jgi:Spy/CpxP family protein refolding chaperone
MKKALVMGFALALLAQICVVAMAHEGKCGPDCGCYGDGKNKGGKGDWQEKRMEHLSYKLDLSTDQKAKLEAILKDDAATMKTSMEKMQADMKARQDAVNAKIKAILTPDQAKKFDEMQKERAEKMEKKMKEHHHGDEEEGEGK